MNIFVGNIAFTASEEDLRELFEQHGTVDKVHLITDRYTGRSRGFGFVEMPDADEAKAAIAALNGASLHNRPLTVNEAPPRKPRRRGGAVGGGSTERQERSRSTTLCGETVSVYSHRECSPYGRRGIAYRDTAN